MNIKILENKDLFTVPQGYYLAHCISGDFALGAGIAKQFVKVCNMKNKLMKTYPIEEGKRYNEDTIGTALLIDNVFNLVTKRRCYHKPLYTDLFNALYDMCLQMRDKDIVKIAMPMIGCGLDGLDWGRVQEIINEAFVCAYGVEDIDKIDVEVLICTL